MVFIPRTDDFVIPNSQASSLVTFQLQSHDLDASATLELRKAAKEVNFKAEGLGTFFLVLFAWATLTIQYMGCWYFFRFQSNCRYGMFPRLNIQKDVEN